MTRPIRFLNGTYHFAAIKPWNSDKIICVGTRVMEDGSIRTQCVAEDPARLYSDEVNDNAECVGDVVELDAARVLLGLLSFEQ